MKVWLQILFFSAVATLTYSCKKEVQDPRPEVVVQFTTTVKGNAVTFNNTTEGGASYKWDFGDGEASTEKSPTHIYKGKGKFVPTLYVTSAGGGVTEGSTVLHISKTSPVVLTDNSFSDWDTIAVNSYTFNTSGNVAKKAKFDYDGSFVYFYFEIQRNLSDNDVYDLYLDTDGAPTGYDVSGYFTGAGIDVLLEGQILNPAVSQPDVFYYVGPGWNWATQTISEYFQKGTVKQEGELVKIEGKIDRSKLKGLTGTALKLGIVIVKNDWSAEVGYIPDLKSPAITIDMNE